MDQKPDLSENRGIPHPLPPTRDYHESHLVLLQNGSGLEISTL